MNHPRQPVRWIHMAVLALLTPTLMAANCDTGSGSPGNPGTVKACDLQRRDGPWLFTTRTDVEIRGSVSAACDRAPRAHRVELWLERDVTDSGNWLLQGRVQRDDRIPGPKWMTVQVSYDGCISGKWRLKARVNGRAPNGDPFRFDLPDSESGATTIRCPGPRG